MKERIKFEKSKYLVHRKIKNQKKTIAKKSPTIQAKQIRSV